MPAAEYRSAARKHWPMVVALTLLGGVVLGASARQQPPVYRAELRLMVVFGTGAGWGPSSSAEVGARLGLDRRLIETRVRRYVQLTGTPRVTGPVVADLGLPYSPGELGKQIRVWSPLDTTFIDIAVTDTDPQRVVAIGNEIAAELAELARNEDRSAGRLARPDVVVVQPPVARAQPDRWPVHLVGGLLGGFAIGVGVATLIVARRSPAAAQRSATVGRQIDGSE